MTTPNLARRVSRARAERLVAYARLAAYVTLTIAVVLTAPPGHGFFPLLVMVPWTIVAALLAWGAWHRGRFAALTLTLVADLLLGGAVMSMTGGAASLLFPLLIMPAFAASVLYERWGMVVSASGAAVIFLATIAAGPEHLHPRMVLVRIGVMVVAWTIIATRAAHESRTYSELEQLATWPRTVTAGREAGVRELLVRTAAVLRAPQIVLAWEETEGTAYVARYGSREKTFSLEEQTDEELDIANGAAIRTEFATQTARGRLCALGVMADEDAQRLAEIVVRLVSSGLDQLHVAAMQRERAAAAERTRLSRDLHDGLLQTLGAVALHAQSARVLVRSDPRAAEERLQLVVEHLGEGQRSLREFVDELRPQLRSRREPLRERLERLARRVASQWNVQVAVDTDPPIDAVCGRLNEDVVALVAEGLTNAARHAGASRIDAVVRLEEGAVCIDVADDGRGFPFRGRYELPQLATNAHAPWSLQERITALGGALAIESTSSGSRVELRVPRERIAEG